MLNDLLLLSGNDIPFTGAQATIHQPTIKEIAYLGEETFFSGCEMLDFSKNILPEEDKIRLGDKTNFDILIAILKEPNAVMQQNRNCVIMVLELIFPQYAISLEDNRILLTNQDEERSIDSSNFDEFQKILIEMFAYKKDGSEKADFNPSGELAKRIADKLKQRQKKLAENKPAQKIDMLSRYVSILSVAHQKDMNALLNYTMYQLLDEFKRAQLKMNHDMYIQAKMAGAKDLKEVEDWMQDIHA